MSLHSSLANDLASLTGTQCTTTSQSTACCPPTPVCCPSTSVPSTPTVPVSATSTAPSTPQSTTTAICPVTPATLATCVSPGNILQSISEVETRIYEIAAAIGTMNTDVSEIEQKLVKRILDSIVDPNCSS